MFDKEDKQKLRNLLLSTMRMMCKNGLPINSSFKIEATIGITLSDGDILLLSFKERVMPDGSIVQQMWSDNEDLDKTHVNDDVDSTDYCEKDKISDLELGDNSDIPTGHVKQEPVGDVTNLFTENHPSNNFRRKDAHLLTVNSSQGHSDEDSHGNNESYFAGYNSWSSCSSGVDNRQIMNESNLMNDIDNFFTASEPLECFDQISNKPGQLKTSKRGKVNSSAVTLNTSVNVKAKQVKRFGSSRLHSNLQTRKVPSYRPKSRELSHSLTKGNISQGLNMSRTISSLCRSLADRVANGESDVAGITNECVFCHICGARLSSTTTLVNHIRGTHLSMNACRCELCGESFKWTMQLSRHRRRFHPETIDSAN